MTGIHTYFPLHLHTGRASHDGFKGPYDMVKRAKELGLDGIALTEHGNMLSAVYLARACQQEGMKAVFGCETYMQPYDQPVKGERKYHLPVLAETNTGLRNLYAMLTEANRAENFYRTPMVGIENLFAHSKGVIVFSGCLSGYIPSLLLQGKYEDARYFAKLMKRQFGHNFYLEVQPFPTGGAVVEYATKGAGSAEAVWENGEEPDYTNGQYEVNKMLIEMGEELAIELVMTGDEHYPEERLYRAFQVNHQLRKKDGLLADYSRRFLHDRTGMEVAWDLMMSDVPGAYVVGDRALDNTVRIAERCNAELDTETEMPDVSDLIAGSMDAFLQDVVEKGMQDLGVSEDPAWQVRVDHELAEIKKWGYTEYFVLCYLVIQFCQSRGIYIAARGSAVSSAVLHVMGGSMVDPIAFGLLFERFISEVHKPDVDFDVPDDRGDEVVSYIQSIFPGRAFPISTFHRWGAKALVNGLKNIYSMSAIDATLMRTILEDMDVDNRPASKEDLLAVKTLGILNERYPGVVEMFAEIHLEVSHYGRHAAGIAITNGKHTKKFPLIRTGGVDGVMQAGADMEALQWLGVPKLDVLRVNYISAVMYALWDAGLYPLSTTLLQQMLSDPDVYKMMAKGDTTTLFQLEGINTRKLLRELKPKEPKDIVLANAFIRPSSVATVNKLLKARAKGKMGSDFWSALLPDSYGFVVFQEDIMVILAAIGFSPKQVDKFLKLLKRGERNKELEEAFVAGVKDHFYVSRLEALDLYQTLSQYGFNKAHAAAYAVWGIIGAWLRKHHPYSWYAAVLRSEDKPDKRRPYTVDAAKHKVNIKPPNVNGPAEYAHIREEIQDDGGVTVDHYVQEGLVALPGIGLTIANAIEAERRLHGCFVDAEDFRKRMPQKTVNKASYATLERYGALVFDQGAIYDGIAQYMEELFSRAS